LSYYVILGRKETIFSAGEYQENLKHMYDKRLMEREGKTWYMRIRGKECKI
jgi:hypothetical protein